MEDPRIRKLARFLIQGAVELQKDEKILIELHGSETGLMKALVQEAYAVGAVGQSADVTLDGTFETLTGHKSIFVTHSQGGAVGRDVPADNIAAIVAIEPGGTPAIGSEQYTKLLSAGIPIAIYFGDYIDNGPEDIMSTSFWRQVRDGALAFAAQYNADGGDCTVVDLPKIGITGNSHFMFQELNNKEIADHIYQWLESRALA